MKNPGNTKHGGHGSLTYARWKSMRQRCRSHSDRSGYRKKGISVCARWDDFASFLADMGECPDGLTLDRIDNTKGYEPGNCRWATREQQNRNRSCIVMLTYDGETKSVSEWAAQRGMRQANLTERLRLGWTVERALNQPIKVYRSAHS
ncbi:hypothetical protein ACOTI8_31790 [Achromobacter xylosoxidans]